MSHKGHHKSRSRVIPNDPIDKLDNILGCYHHGGPFDATLHAAQSGPLPPIEALSRTNALALKFTPGHAIKRSVELRTPLEDFGTVGEGKVEVTDVGVENDGLDYVGDLLPREDDGDVNDLIALADPKIEDEKEDEETKKAR